MAIEKNPRHRRKRAPQQRQGERVPAVQLDDVMAFVAAAPNRPKAAIIAVSASRRRSAGRSGRRRLSWTAASIGGASDHQMVRGRAASICGTQRRAAARHVENEAARREALRARGVRHEVVDRHAITEHAVERVRERAPDRLLEERLAERLRAEMRPIDVDSRPSAVRDMNGKPRRRRANRAVRGRRPPACEPERVRRAAARKVSAESGMPRAVAAASASATKRSVSSARASVCCSGSSRITRARNRPSAAGCSGRAVIAVLGWLCIRARPLTGGLSLRFSAMRLYTECDTRISRLWRRRGPR